MWDRNFIALLFLGTVGHVVYVPYYMMLFTPQWDRLATHLASVWILQPDHLLHVRQARGHGRIQAR